MEKNLTSNNSQIKEFDIEDKITVCKNCDDIIIPVSKDICSSLFCFNETSTVVAKYCYKCAKKKNRCYICGENLKVNDGIIENIVDFFSF